MTNTSLLVLYHFSPSHVKNDFSLWREKNHPTNLWRLFANAGRQRIWCWDYLVSKLSQCTLWQPYTQHGLSAIGARRYVHVNTIDWCVCVIDATVFLQDTSSLYRPTTERAFHASTLIIHCMSCLFMSLCLYVIPQMNWLCLPAYLPFPTCFLL